MANFFNPFAQYLDDSARILPGAKLYFYVNGTTTEQDTFADAARTIPNTNPVICDAGRIPPIFMPPDDVYTVVLTTAGDVPIDQADDYSGVLSATDEFSSGTFSPVLSDGTNDATMSGISNGTYTKVDTTVYFTARAYATNISALSAATALRITGLPFTAKAGTNVIYPLTLHVREGSLLTNTARLQPIINQAENYISLQYYDIVGGTIEDIVKANIATDFDWTISGFYFTT